MKSRDGIGTSAVGSSLRTRYLNLHVHNPTKPPRPDNLACFYVVWTLFIGSGGQGVHFWVSKSRILGLEKIYPKSVKRKKKLNFIKFLNVRFDTKVEP